MKKCFFRYRLALFVLLGSSFILAEDVWRGTSVVDVFDQDLVIEDNVILPAGPTVIKAVTRDITITLSRDVQVAGNSGVASQLYLIAAEGRKIRFEVDHNLQFVGSSTLSGEDLLIVQSCPGVVEVAIAQNKSFELTSTTSTAGVQMFVLMYGGQDAPLDEYCSDEYGNVCPQEEYTEEYCSDEYCLSCDGTNEVSDFRPILSFISLGGVSRASNNDKKIIIGAGSRLSFLSSRTVDIAGDSAYISFDPSTSTSSRMVLEIADTGSFVAAGHLTRQRNGGLITLNDIDLTTAAGDEAIWTIFNSQGPNFTAGLLVLDANQTLFDLLEDPFLNLDARNQSTGYKGAFSGNRLGCVVGANGVLWVQADAYLDFVGLALNQIPSITDVPGFGNTSPSRLIKMRNPSALFIDGNNNPDSIAARVLFGLRSAIFFRSGIADDGTIRPLDDVDAFTIDAANRTQGVGNIVFDVEGELNVEGPGAGGQDESKIELLSLEVVPSGGSLFVGSPETNFPLRTFNTEDGELLAYNTGAFLINNQMNLADTSLVHSDVSHNVCPNNDIRSEPTYIGGETFILLDPISRPAINFFNADFRINTDVALTGVDLSVPNLVDPEGVAQQNLVRFIFYSNGACVDNGTGRQMILGTRIGSTAFDGCSRIDGDSHLNIMEEFNAIASNLDPLDPNGNQTLFLNSAMNDSTITSPIEDTATSSIHTIFLGGTSNISIGVNADSTGFNIDTNPWLRIQGNVFSFETRNGLRGYITGTNAIFVDLNGEISIDPNFIAYFAVMVVKSHNGIVDLPSGQVFFAPGFGIVNWNVDLSDPLDQIIVPAGQTLSSYLFNWILAKKDCANFTPYQVTDVNMCNCPPVTEANVTSLPTVQGTIDDFIVQASRIGDPIQIAIDGGTVRQLTFPTGSCSAQAPVAVIVLSNGGSVGIDNTTTLGANGVIIIADGSGRVNINTDVVINNVCAIVKGPNFAACDVIQLYSPVPREVLLKSGGTLDLTTFDNVDDIIEIAGELRLVVEPGAKIINGMGTLRFADDTQLLFEPADNVAAFFAAIPHGAHDPLLDPTAIVDASLPHNELASLTNFAAGLANTDTFRVSIIGQGAIELIDNAQGFIPTNAFVGIETIDTGTCDIPLTDIELRLADNANFVIGRSNFTQGGVLQVGNVTDLGAAHSVSFTLTLDGNDANFLIGSGGFVGFGVGIERFDGPAQVPVTALTRAASCPITFVPNENIVDTLNNVSSISFNFLNGRFLHDRIASGDTPSASLVAISGATGTTYNITFNPALPDDNIDPTEERESNFNIAGGGNLVLIETGTGGIHPVVLDEDGVITPRLSASIMASTLLQADNVDVTDITGLELFEEFKTHDALLEPTRDNTFGRANAASSGDSFRPGFVDVMLDMVSQGAIVRGAAFDIIGVGEDNSKRRNAIDTGAVFVNIDPTLNEILTATNIEA